MRDLNKRIIFSVLLLIIWYFATFINLPMLNEDVLNQFSIGFPGRFSLLTTGINPFLEAYVIAILLSIFIWPNKGTYFVSNLKYRKTRKTALFLTIPIALINGSIIANLILSYNYGLMNPLIITSSPLFFKLILCLTITAVTFCLIWTTSQNTRIGIGHGISLFMLLILSLPLASSFLEVFVKKTVVKGQNVFLINMVLLLLMVAVIYFVERSAPLKKAVAFNIPLKRTPAGLFPILLSSSFIDISFEHGFLFQGTNLTILIVTTFLLSYIFGFLFFRPRKLMSFSGCNDRNTVVKLLFVSCSFNAIYLLFIYLVPKALFGVLEIPPLFHGITVLILTVIVMDFIREIRYRTTANYEKVTEIHDVAVALICGNHLVKKEIPYFFKAFHHRSLGYFLSPFLEMDLYVSKENTLKTKALVENLFKENTPKNSSPD